LCVVLGGHFELVLSSFLTSVLIFLKPSYVNLYLTNWWNWIGIELAILLWPKTMHKSKYAHMLCMDHYQRGQGWNSLRARALGCRSRKEGIWKSCQGCQNSQPTLPKCRCYGMANGGPLQGTGSQHGGMSEYHKDGDQCRCRTDCFGSILKMTPMTV
jgi:hypothetical protein